MRMSLPFGQKEWPWQAEQGPDGQGRRPLRVPEHLNIISYPDRSACFGAKARASRRRVYCPNPNCIGRDGKRSWTFAERADKYNPEDKGKGKGAGAKGVCILCGTDYPDEIWQAAPIERVLNNQWNEFRAGNGPPPDYPEYYGEPGSETGCDIYPEGDPNHWSAYQVTPSDWEWAHRVAKTSAMY